MEQSALSKKTVSFGISLAVASLANALLVIAKEKSPALQSLMRRLTGHHWVTHSAVILGLFFLMGFLLSRRNGGAGIKMTASRLITALLSGVALGGMLIVGFYLFAD